MAKLFVALTVLCVFGAVLGAMDKKAAMAKFMLKMQSCKGEVGATEADMKELLAKNPASSKEGKCLRACVMKTYKVMDSNGKFSKTINLTNAKKYYEGDADKIKTAIDIINACNDISVSDDHCEAAEQYATCLVKKALAQGSKPIESNIN